MSRRKSGFRLESYRKYCVRLSVLCKDLNYLKGLRKNIVLLFLLSLCFIACNQGDIRIQIEIGQGLEDNIEIVSAVSQKPGAVNPVESMIELKNVSDVEVRLLYEGTWYDDRDNYYGSNRSLLILEPHQTQKIEAATRSTRATRFKLLVNRTQLTQDEVLTASLKNEEIPRAEGYGFTYTETPTLGTIPAWTVRGKANGEPFQAKTIIFSPFVSKWRLQIIDTEVDPLKGIAIARLDKPEIQVINIDLPNEPKDGDVMKKEISFGGGYFQIKTSPDSRGTTSWNTDNAWIIQITEWEKKPWIEGEGTFQQVGKASGRLYVSFKGSEQGFRNSWISGTFEDAAIVYYGKPQSVK